MIDLMPKLLTYEPYEKVSGNEKEYIYKVLCGDIASDTFVINKEYVMYDELFRGFISHVQYAVDGINRKRIKWESLDWLSEWKDKYYPFVNGMIKGRAVYPVIFKKICFFWLVEVSHIGTFQDDVKYVIVFVFLCGFWGNKCFPILMGYGGNASCLSMVRLLY